jgi:hypothetical protein
VLAADTAPVINPLDARTSGGCPRGECGPFEPCRARR